MTKMALMITAEAKVVKLELNEDTELKQLQQAVDGYIEAVDLSPDLIMWVNEEGLLRDNLEPNPVAFGYYGSLIMGSVVFTGGIDENGNTVGLSEESAKRIRKHAKTCRELLFS